MQNQEFRDYNQQSGDKPSRRRKSNNTLAGLLILVAGSVLLIRQVEADLVPRWLFTWPMILVVVGFFVGIQTRFRDFGWLILIGIGAFFLADNVFPDYDAGRFIIPVVVCGVGLTLMLSPGKKRRHKNKDHEKALYYKDADEEPSTGKTDTIEVVSIFGNVKKNVYSKDFKGGEVVSVFGGAEVNLSQADFKGPITLEIVQVFGGTKLIVPPHWVIRSEAVAIFGGIEDKRPPQSITSPDKVLIIQGTALFAGIEIKSY
ncbi:LiaF transmembrane domain-containing protein [Paraflavitalea speifideaquila]|uniref:LiaF transmembrane domain-containing protein n=1 Tax=Paraflavitalea speifideaquila TaxID=3076558 RepID=UPI0028EE375B|nr:LiaF domain-containing protein [Paraflavitalea speifideiaquila]